MGRQDAAPVDQQPLWLDPLGTGYDSKLDQDLRLQRFADDLGRKLRDVEQARWHLAGVEHNKLRDPRLAGYRGQVERLRDVVVGTCADLLAALPEPEPPAEPAGLLDRLRGR
jgi:hypothetical protein